MATSYLLGVSTRRMEKLVSTLGIDRLSKSQVSVIAKELNAQVEAFRTRPLDAGPYTFLAADAGPCFTKLPNARDHPVFRMFRCADLQSAGQLVRVEPLTLAVLGRSGSSHRSGSGTQLGQPQPSRTRHDNRHTRRGRKHLPYRGSGPSPAELQAGDFRI